MTIGPVEYVILGFPDNNFTGQMAPALAKLIDSGLIRLIDLTFISEDVAGDVTVIEYDAVEELAAFADLDAEIGEILTDEDIAHAALSLKPNTSAALLIWEDTWAAPFAEAVRNANGIILEGARIPHHIVEQTMDALADPPRLRPVPQDRRRMWPSAGGAQQWKGNRHVATTSTSGTNGHHRGRGRDRSPHGSQVSAEERGGRPGPVCPAQAQSAPPEAAPTAPQAGESAEIEELKQLAALKDQGILTEEEFSAKKAQILGL